jgi:hypothetical protein
MLYWDVFVGKDGRSLLGKRSTSVFMACAWAVSGDLEIDRLQNSKGRSPDTMNGLKCSTVVCRLSLVNTSSKTACAAKSTEFSVMVASLLVDGVGSL